jgi:excisionase family DNA binding protein
MNPYDVFLDAVRQIVREEVSSAVKKQPPAKLTYDTAESAIILGVPESWLAAAAREGKVRSVRIGHYVRFRLSDLQEFIESRTAANE